MRIHSTIVVCLVVVYLVVGLSTPWAQAQDDDQDLHFVSLVRSVQNRARPGGNLILRARVENHGEQPAQGTLVAQVKGHPRQSARKVAVAAQSAEIVDIHIRLPMDLPKGKLMDIECALYRNSGGAEVITQWRGRPQQHSVSLEAQRLSSLTGMAPAREHNPQPPWYWPPDPIYAVYEFPVATRIDSGNSRQSINFDVTPLPMDGAAWDEMDVMVISDGRYLDDLAALQSLKRYVSQGGRVWIFIDLVSCEQIRSLLVDDQSIEEIDTIEINACTIDITDGLNSLKAEDRQLDIDVPVQFKRVIQTGGRVSHEIDGWPVAIWMPSGKGEFLFTTLDSNAWIKPRTVQDKDNRRYAAYETRSWARQFAVSANTIGGVRMNVELPEYPIKQIGNPVVARSWVFLALVGFCILCGAIGSVHYMGRESSQLVLLAPPVLAVVCAGALLTAASYVRRDIPESVARLQQIQVTEDGEMAMVEEHSAVYLAASRDMQMSCEKDGKAFVEEDLTSGICRSELSDFHRWSLHNATWPAGAWRYTAKYNLPTDGLWVTARMNQRGVKLIVPTGLPSELEDPILEYRTGNAMLCKQEDDGWFCDGSMRAQGERFIGGTLLSAEQQRRSKVYSDYLRRSFSNTGRERAFLGWTERWPDAPEWSQDLEQKGSAFVSLPVRIERPNTGEDIFIPHGFVRLRRNPDAVGQTAAYSDDAGTWATELSLAVKGDFQFVLPKELLPFDASAIELEVDVKAPYRNVTLLSNVPGQEPIEILRLENPSIPVTKTLTNPVLLQDAQDGVLDFSLAVSERTDVENAESASNVVMWSIDHVHASFRGAVMPTSSLSKSQ